MSKEDQYPRAFPEPHVVERTAWLHTITRFWVTVFLLVVIVYVTALLIGRTDGFRELVRQRMEKILGLPITIESMQISPWLELRLVGLREAGVTNRPPALVVGSASVRADGLAILRGRPFPVRSVELSDAVLRFSPRGAGRWTPFPELAETLLPWLQVTATDAAAETISPTEWLRRHGMRISAENVRLVWLSGGGEADLPVALADGIAFSTARVRPFDEPVLWCRLAVAHAQTGGEEWLRDLDLEFLRLPDQDVILRLRGWEPTAGGNPYR
ncbi:MAG TPA: hypothetical protein PKA51_09185 [Kiritimatiellia bacterium]|nr:hypothetical protein [Kiritimatiellia bacterium]